MIALFRWRRPNRNSGIQPTRRGRLMQGVMPFRPGRSAVRARAKEAGTQAARDVWIYSAMFEPTLENPTVASRLVQIITDYSGWHWVNDNPLRALEPPAARRLDTIRVPTLIIIGRRMFPIARLSRKLCMSASLMRARQ